MLKRKQMSTNASLAPRRKHTFARKGILLSHVNKVHKRDLVINTRQTISTKNTQNPSYVRKESLQNQCDNIFVEESITTMQTVNAQNMKQPN